MLLVVNVVVLSMLLFLSLFLFLFLFLLYTVVACCWLQVLVAVLAIAGICLLIVSCWYLLAG